MKVIHIVNSYYPDPVGGTEIYVRSLASQLRKSGVESIVSAPGHADAGYVHAGVRVRRFAGRTRDWPLEYFYEHGDEIAARAFAGILWEEMPDLVHFHTLNAMVSPRIARDIAAQGVPLVFTYHAGAATCQIDSMLRWGRERCNGELVSTRCAACNLHKLGMPRPLAGAIARTPVKVGRWIARHRASGGASTALRMNELVARRHAGIREFLGLAARVVAPSAWVEELLLANGVPRCKVLRHPQGIDSVRAPAIARRRESRSGPLHAVILARVDPAKGVHVVVEGLANRRDVDVKVDAYCVPQAGDDSAYLEVLRRRVAADSRFRLLPAIAHDQVHEILSRYDVVLVPSQVLETGPLVVLEAFAAGLPVIGSDLGGISERVFHDVNGLLVPAFEPSAWASALHRMGCEPGLLSRLASGISPPHRMEAVTESMAAIYRELAPPIERARAHRPRFDAIAARALQTA